MNYLDELNPAQSEAVKNVEGPVMIIAGPGSGKTRVLTYRIAYLIQKGVDPFNILSLTFTNKAAREMRERIEKVVGMEARNLWMGTFHSVFARILRYEAEKLGYTSNFTIYDTQDSRNLIKNIVKEQNLNDKLYKPNFVLYRISSAKNSLISPKEYATSSNLTSEDESGGRSKMSMLYELYTKRCFQAGAMDFDDLLVKMHELITRFPDALYKYQHKFKYILVDEYQDTNYAQYAITKKLADVFQNICVVGDDAQSIYSFRGANIENILNFEKDYPELKVFKLEQNYRSTKHIVNVANKVIIHNKAQLPKEIWTDNQEGERIKIVKALSDNDEGKIVADSIFEYKMRYHYKNSDFAILYRTNAQSRAFEEAFRRLNIPYKVYGGLSFYQRKEIKDLLAYLKLIVNPHDEEALRRIINYPARGIGKTTLESATVIASEEGKSLWQVLVYIDQYSFTPRAKSTIKDFVNMIKSFTTMLESKNAYDLALHVAKSTGLMKELYNDKSVEGLSRYENIQELLNSIKEFTEQDEVIEGQLDNDKSLGSYLQNVMLLTDQDTDNTGSDWVSLMTVHSAKGLEFECLYVVGLEENLFPSMMSMNSREDLEEERRLFYVAVTRAKSRLSLTFAKTRYRFGSLMYCDPSRFLEELPSENVEFTGHKSREQYDIVKPLNFRKPMAVKPQPKVTFTNTDYSPSGNFVPDDPYTLQVGMEVEHQKFGIGKVISLEGKEDNKISTIFFKGIGQKRIMLKYAKVMILNRNTVD